MRRLAMLCLALAAAGPTLAQSDYVLPPLSEFPAMVERPLFAPSRLGVAPAQTHASASNGERRLIGTMRRGGQRVALLLIDGAGRSLSPGEVLDGWRLLSVEAGAVQFAAADGTRLRLPVGGALP